MIAKLHDLIGSLYQHIWSFSWIRSLFAAFIQPVVMMSSL